MAPEIILRKPYNGTSVDLFSAGVILFTMIWGYPPFHKATNHDNFYRCIVAKRIDFFWKRHNHKKAEKDCQQSDDLKDLIASMLKFNPEDRLSI